MSVKVVIIVIIRPVVDEDIADRMVAMNTAMLEGDSANFSSVCKGLRILQGDNQGQCLLPVQRLLLAKSSLRLRGQQVKRRRTSWWRWRLR